MKQIIALITTCFLISCGVTQPSGRTISKLDTVVIRDSVFIPLPEQHEFKNAISIVDLGCNKTVDCGKILTDYVASQPINSRISLYIPAGDYYFASTFYVEDRCIDLIGDGVSKSFIYVKDGITGIWLDRKIGILSPNYLQGFWMGAFGKSNTDADGIRIWHQSTLSNVSVSAFGGCGIHIDGFVTGNPDNDASHNASFSKIYDCAISANGLDGILIDGADGNACITMCNDIRNNGGWGLRESSFLGGTHIGNMFHANKLGPFTVDGPSNASCFIGGYTEGDQPPVLIYRNNHVVGASQYFSTIQYK